MKIKIENLFIKDKENFIEKMKYYINILKPGLKKGRSLYNDGILKLSLADLRFLENSENTEIANKILVLLTVFIQAFPKNSASFENEDDLITHVKCLEMLFATAVLEKHDCLNAISLGNKIELDKEIKIILNPNYIE